MQVTLSSLINWIVKRIDQSIWCQIVAHITENLKEVESSSNDIRKGVSHYQQQYQQNTTKYNLNSKLTSLTTTSGNTAILRLEVLLEKPDGMHANFIQGEVLPFKSI